MKNVKLDFPQSQVSLLKKVLIKRINTCVPY